MNTFKLWKRRIQAWVNENITHRGETPEEFLKIKKLTIDEKGQVDALLSHPNVAMLALEAAQWFNETGATNYVEYRLYDRASRRPYTITIKPEYRFDKDDVVRIMREALEEIAGAGDYRSSLDYDAPRKAINTLIKLGYRKDAETAS